MQPVIVGLIVVVASGFIVRGFLSACNRWHGLPDRRQFDRMDARLLGLFERFFAFLVVIVFWDTKEAAALLLAGWMGAKLLSNWHRGPYDVSNGPDRRRRRSNDIDERGEAVWRTRTFIALMTGVVSLGIGVLGGLIAIREVRLPAFLDMPWY